MSFVGDLVAPETRDPLLKAAGCRPWDELRRQAERERSRNRVDTHEDTLRKRRTSSRIKARNHELMELEALMSNAGGGELGSVT